MYSRMYSHTRHNHLGLKSTHVIFLKQKKKKKKGNILADLSMDKYNTASLGKIFLKHFTRIDNPRLYG